MSSKYFDRLMESYPPVMFNKISWTCGMLNIMVFLRNVYFIGSGKYIKDSIISAKRLFNRKNTFYFDRVIDGKSVDQFKKFMWDIQPEDEINIIIKTNGGAFTSAQIISGIIGNHEGVTNAMVLDNAFSGGTLIALSCKNLYMHKNAHLSPVDVTQCSFFDQIQLSSIDSVIDNKSKDEIDDKTYIMSDQAKKAQRTLNEIFDKIIKPRYNTKTQETIKEELFSGTKHLHSTAFPVDKLKDLGIVVKPLEPDMVRMCKLTFDENKFY